MVTDEIIGVASYSRSRHVDSAEIAVVVEDAWQRHGVGSRLLLHLRCRAYASGIHTFHGTMHADNRPIIELLRTVFRVRTYRLETGVLEVEIPIGHATDGSTPPNVACNESKV